MTPGIRLWSVVVLLVAIEVDARTFHVSRKGNDSNPGTEKKPFATLARARDAVRTLKNGKALRHPVTVLVHRGAYQQPSTLELSAEDSGTPSCPVTWRAAREEEVRVTGGPVLPAAAFTPVTDKKILARLDPSSQGFVRQLKLRDFVSTELPAFPQTFRGVPAAPELFFANQRMTLARWPNKGWATIAKIITQGSVPREGDKGGIPGAFEYSDERPDRWNTEQGVWLQGYWCYDWYDESIRVRSIDREKNQITMDAPALYGVRQGNPSPRRYRALNLLEELDAPGEFYIDRVAGLLYFWPPAAVDEAEIALSVLDAPLLSFQEVEHVTFNGFIFEASLGNGIEISGGKSNRVERCTIRNTRLLGIRAVGGTGHVVASCNIHDTGTGGLLLEGGDRKTLTPAQHQAINNHIWQFSRHQLTAAYGLTLGGVGNRAAHNVLHDAPHQAIFINGNDHVFEFNSISNVVMDTDDAGALYKGRNPSCRGNVIRHNYWRNIGSPMGHGTAAIYFDDGDGGDLVFGNIFVRSGQPGGGSFGTVFSHGGHDIRAENNIFVECGRAMGSAPWPDHLWKETVDGGHDCHFQVKLLQEVDITKSPYTNRYPELVGFMNPQPGQVRNNLAKNNVLVRCGAISSGNWTFPAEKTWSTEGDPGFVDFTSGKLQLRSDAEVFKRLPEFRSIPFEKIGFEQGQEPPAS